MVVQVLGTTVYNVQTLESTLDAFSVQYLIIVKKEHLNVYHVLGHVENATVLILEITKLKFVRHVFQVPLVEIDYKIVVVLKIIIQLMNHRQINVKHVILVVKFVQAQVYVQLAKIILIEI